MAKPLTSSHDTLALKALLILLALGLGSYIVGPPLYWELKESIATAHRPSSCSPCRCDCADSKSVEPGASLCISDCTKLDHLLQDANYVEIHELLQELNVQEFVDEERQLDSANAYLEVKKLTSQYLKEAEKCNVGMETSEEAREKAEGVLLLEIEITKLWEHRARQLGWQEASERNASEVESEEVPSLKLSLGKEANTATESISNTTGKSEE